MKKVKAWFVKNKDELLVGWGVAASALCLLLIVFVIMLIAMTEDLTNVATEQKKELSANEDIIETLTYERNYYFGLADDLMQTYEEVVPKGQYIQDVEYLESVILELRGQCEIELNKKCDCQ